MSTHMMGQFEKLIRQIPADAVDRQRALDDLRAIREAMETSFWPAGKETFRSARGRVRLHVVPAGRQDGSVVAQIAVHCYHGTSRTAHGSIILGLSDNVEGDRAYAIAAIRATA